MKWSHREDLVLGRTLEPLVVPINIYKNMYGIIPILVLEGVVSDSWMIFWECGYI
jgi:hypothetical protein